MVSEGKEDILKDNPKISKIIAFNHNNKTFSENIENYNVDLAVIISPGKVNFKFLTDICYKNNIKYTIGGFGGFKRGIGFNFNQRSFPSIHKHTVMKNLEIIKNICKIPNNPSLEFYINDEDKISAQNILKQSKIKDYIIVHPGFGKYHEYPFPSRLWPLDRYSKIIDIMIEKYDTKVIITGTKEELEIATKIYELIDKKNSVLILNGKINYGELAYIVKNSRLVISTSTSIIHLASCFDCRVLELGGKELVCEWKPWMDINKYKLIIHDEVCTQCNLLNCRKKTIECLNAITINEVIQNSDQLIKSK